MLCAASLFESSQSLFWASFGLMDLSVFEMSGIKSYTRFWGMMMFGTFSIINVVVLLNLLIAMMSNSYTLITVRTARYASLIHSMNNDLVDEGALGHGMEVCPCEIMDELFRIG